MLANLDQVLQPALEGGYELHSLARCTELHLRVLMDLH